MRRMCLDLIHLTSAMTDFTRYYGAHVGRGKWQDDAIRQMYAALGEPENRGKVVILTIDMKSKTVKDKHRCEQGHGMGAKGMSLQGGMVDGYRDGKWHTHYVDVIYEQSSNQCLEEAMCGLVAQIEEIRATWPGVTEVWINSDKCGNFIHLLRSSSLDWQR